MLTFLELYQTLLGFVFFKLYTDAGLVYPPPLDQQKDESGAGVGAFIIQEMNQITLSPGTQISKTKKIEVDGKIVSGKEVKKTIKAIEGAADSNMDVDETPSAALLPADDTMPSQEEFIVQTSSKNADTSASNLPTLHSLTALPSTLPINLFAPYTFYISRESPRTILEFAIRSFGGRVGWPETVGAGSPFTEDDDSITHVIIDRPPIIPAAQGEATITTVTKTLTDKERRRKYVQPQWVVDCINAGRILVEDPYGRGKVLPPHLSPFGEVDGAYDPTAEPPAANAEDEESEEDVIEGEELPDEEEDESENDEVVEDPPIVHAQAPKLASTLPPPPSLPTKSSKKSKKSKSTLPAAAATDPELLRKAELEAERAGIDPATFDQEIAQIAKAAKRGADNSVPQEEEWGGVVAGADNPNKMLMSNKQRKLYEKMKYSQRQKADEASLFNILFIPPYQHSFLIL